MIWLLTDCNHITAFISISRWCYKKKLAGRDFLIAQMEVKMLKQMLSQLSPINAELYTNAFSQKFKKSA